MSGQQETGKQGALVLATGGMPDHIPLAATLILRPAVSKFVQPLGGVSSADVRHTLAAGEFFGGQDHDAAFNISHSHVEYVVPSMENQKQHDANSTRRAEWEETEKEALIKQVPGANNPRH